MIIILFLLLLILLPHHQRQQQQPPVPFKETLNWVSRSGLCGELSVNDAGKRVLLCGWVALYRVHGGLTFLNLRDHTVRRIETQSHLMGVVTTLPDEFPDARSIINDLRLQYVVAVEGVVQSRPFESVAAENVQIPNAVRSKLLHQMMQRFYQRGDPSENAGMVLGKNICPVPSAFIRGKMIPDAPCKMEMQ
ncbi:hypothetical protein RCOM_1382360 [Ricinus communis]|uniref:OB domain-containing protein n=1 Tax=Ricinus communis TaxID=3988 RepID=B9S7X2_RICCO|nr:hypothetical protein RCOM_1382360 [Ricinus communis]